jgi:hypothetical protein
MVARNPELKHRAIVVGPSGTGEAEGSVAGGWFLSAGDLAAGAVAFG